MSDLLPFDFDEDSAPEDDGNTLASRVLIVDDETVVLDVMGRLLQRESDLVITTLGSAEAALELLKDERFDVLITDKNLPGMGGVELIEQAKRLRPAMEAVMITGYASGESVIAALAAGASDYLLKPFEDLRTVRAKIRAALDRRKERSEGRQKAHALAKAAKALLDQGKDAPEAEWLKLETAFKRYEQAIREGGRGHVILVGSDRALPLLNTGEFKVARVEPEDAAVDVGDVVVLETTVQDWRQVADRLVAQEKDLILLASPSSDLADLLEAISLRLELVGYGGKNVGVLSDRVRAALMRRAVQKAQAELASELQRFRAVLAK